MRTAYSVESVRAAEHALMARVPDGALMQRAAAGLAVACGQLLGKVYGARVVLLVGSGDNGGDALYAGARLARRGAGVTAVLLAPERVHGGGLAAFRGAGGRVVRAVDGAEGGEGSSGDRGVVSEGALAAVGRAQLVVDGIVGIGGKGALRPLAARLVRAAEDSGSLVVAVDLPSGVDADTGQVAGDAVRADATVTFGTYKPGLLVDPGREYAGAVRLVDIGLDGSLGPHEAALEALQYVDVERLLPVPGAESGPTISAMFKDGPLAGRSIEAEVLRNFAFGSSRSSALALATSPVLFGVTYRSTFCWPGSDETNSVRAVKSSRDM